MLGLSAILLLGGWGPAGGEARVRVLIQASPLAGSQFHALDAVIGQVQVGDPLTLVREPANRHDARAIRVEWRGLMLGYVPRRENRLLASVMDRGEPVVARVAALVPGAAPWQRLRFEVLLEL